MFWKRTVTKSQEYAESIINTVREPLIALNQDLRVVSASRSFYKVFKVNPEETMGQLIYDLGNKQWDIPKLRELLETILPEKATFDNYEVEHDFATIGRRVMLLNARQIQRGSGKERIILLAIEDITERKKAVDVLQEKIAELENAHSEINALHGIIPICSSCKKIRDDQGYWHQVEVYVRDHSEADFSHGICPECAHKLYPEIYKDRE